MNISWGRILSVAIPVSVALIVGIWIGQELIRPQVTIQYGLFSKNLKRWKRQPESAPLGIRKVHHPEA